MEITVNIEDDKAAQILIEGLQGLRNRGFIERMPMEVTPITNLQSCGEIEDFAAHADIF